MPNFISPFGVGRAMIIDRLHVLGALALLACGGDSPAAPTATAPAQAPPEITAGSNYSFSINSAEGTVRVKFARIRSEGTESVGVFVRRMFASADSASATRLVLDLSATKGGDAFLAVPLVRGVLSREKFARHGGLVIIVGPDTFSPGQSAASLLQRYAKPIFVSRW